MTTSVVELNDGERLTVDWYGDGPKTSICVTEAPRASVVFHFETPEQATAFVSRLVALVMPGEPRPEIWPAGMRIAP